MKTLKIGFYKLLRQASHDVITVKEAELMGQPDSVVLNYAKKSNRILLTYNCDDFEALHEANSTHSGMLAIYRSSNRSKNMTF
jgi:predicted nuclease of predicted toxin-antitoxin system